MTRLALLCILVLGCSTKQKAEITEEALSDPGRRHEIFESTLRALDEHPDYVDEFFNMALKHRTMDSFLESTTRGLTDRAFARRVGEHLAAHPPGLKVIMIETLEASRPKPAAHTAIVDAVAQEADITASFLLEKPEQLGVVMKAIVQQLKDHPDKTGTLKELIAGLEE
jgi:hypothetical protein